jgi:hypothetical protein
MTVDDDIIDDSDSFSVVLRNTVKVADLCCRAHVLGIHVLPHDAQNRQCGQARVESESRVRPVVQPHQSQRWMVAV